MSLKEELEELNTKMVIGSTFELLHENENEVRNYSNKEEEELMNGRLAADVNQCLQALGIPLLKHKDFSTTIVTVQALLRHRQADLEFKNNLHTRTRKQDNNYQQLDKAHQSLQGEHKRLQEHNRHTTHQLNQLHKQHKALQATLKQEQEDYSKQIKQYKHKEQQHSNELRRKEQDIQAMQQQLQQIAMDNSGQVKLEVINPKGNTLQHNQWFNDKVADHEFSMLVAQVHGASYQRLLKENHKVKAFLVSILKQLVEINKYSNINSNQQQQQQQQNYQQELEDLQKYVEKPFGEVEEKLKESMQEQLGRLQDLRRQIDPEFTSQLDTHQQPLLAKLFNNFWQVIDTQQDILNKNIDRRKVTHPYQIQQAFKKQYHIFNESEIENCRKDLIKFKQEVDNKKIRLTEQKSLLDQQEKTQKEIKAINQKNLEEIEERVRQLQLLQ